MQHRIGAHVQVHGLKEAVAYNGQVGVIQDRKSYSRWRIQLRDCNGNEICVDMKTENITVIRHVSADGRANQSSPTTSQLPPTPASLPAPAGIRKAIAVWGAPVSVSRDAMSPPRGIKRLPVDNQLSPEKRPRHGPARMCIIRDAQMPHPLQRNHVLICSEFFCAEGDWRMYNEIRNQLQWSMHKSAAHLSGYGWGKSPTCKSILDKINSELAIEPSAVGINWYRNGCHYKNFHRDAHASNANVAAKENLTAIASFGAARTLIFKPFSFAGEDVSFTLRNGMLFLFCCDVNADYVHGIEESAEPCGRIAVSRWGRRTLEDVRGGSDQLWS